MYNILYTVIVRPLYLVRHTLSNAILHIDDINQSSRSEVVSRGFLTGMMGYAHTD